MFLHKTGFDSRDNKINGTREFMRGTTGDILGD